MQFSPNLIYFSVFHKPKCQFKSNIFIISFPEMSESDLLASDHIDGLDGLENGQDGDAIMQCDGVKREINETNVDDPVSHYHFLIPFPYLENHTYFKIKCSP